VLPVLPAVVNHHGLSLSIQIVIVNA
jgi:hypothetical protein